MKICIKQKQYIVFFSFIVIILLFSDNAFAMHISEGILPPKWALLWFVLALPFVALGISEIKKNTQKNLSYKGMVGLIGASVFVVSCMPIPVPTAGTCSHPAGTGLAAIFIGPAQTVFVTSIALVLQALFLAHGGITTLGADIFSMGVAGAYAGYGAFFLARKLKLPVVVAAFLAGLFSDWATYTVTSFELASALHGTGSMTTMFWAILLAFVPTQVPLGIIEGIISAGAYRFVKLRRPSLLIEERFKESGAAI